MRYVVQSALLLSRLQNLERVIIAKNSVALLQDFLFEIEGNTMKVTASDSETIIKTSIELIEASQDAVFAIDAKKFLGILKEIPEQPLTMEVSQNLKVDLTYQNGYFSIQGERAEDYPQAKALEGEPKTIALEAQAFGKAIGSALIAASKDMGRKVMTGVFLDITPSDVSLVASDGHKLVKYAIKADTGIDKLGVTIPQKPAQLIKSMTDKLAENIHIAIYPSGDVALEMASYAVRFRLIEDPFPNYRSVIPQNNTNIATIDRASFVSAMRRVMVLSDKTTTLVKFQFAENEVVLTAEDINYAQSAEERLVCQYEGMPLQIGFKGTDLLELVNNMQSTEFVFQLGDHARAGLMLPAVQTEGTELLMLQMPLLVNR